MTIDEYLRRTAELHRQIQEIADLTANQALANCANSENPTFVDLMKRREDLLKRSIELTRKMMQQLGI